MIHLDGSVGKQGNNDCDDVEAVQELLQEAARKTGNRAYDPLFTDGIIFPFASRTVDCICAFQSRFMNNPDGVISPGYRTIRELSAFASGGGGEPDKPQPTVIVGGNGCCFPLAQVPRRDYHRPAGRAHFRGLYFGGKRTSNGRYRKHAGCDLIVPDGTPIYAVDEGVVHWVSRNFLGGTRANGVEWTVGYVTVIHKDFTVRYCETRTNFSVKVGDTVKKGQRIAQVGKMNKSSMLHFELYSDNKPGGKLSDRSQPTTKKFGDDTPFQRRRDLVDPTKYLDKWKGNLPTLV